MTHGFFYFVKFRKTLGVLSSFFSTGKVKILRSYYLIIVISKYL